MFLCLNKLSSNNQINALSFLVESRVTPQVLLKRDSDMPDTEHLTGTSSENCERLVHFHDGGKRGS